MKVRMLKPGNPFEEDEPMTDVVELVFLKTRKVQVKHGDGWCHTVEEKDIIKITEEDHE